MKRISLFGVTILLAAIFLTACGNFTDAQAPVSSIEVEMSEFKFNPTDMVVSVGKEITLNLSNNGVVEHDFTILKKGVTAQLPYDREKQAQDILFEARLGSKSSGRYTFVLPEAGEYQVICGIQGHAEAGMVASMIAK